MTRHVVIIGAGIVGVSTAVWLQRDGHKVTLIDRSEPGEGASYGNGGILASAAIVPVTGPGLLRRAPGMLFDRNQPLFMKWSYLPKLLPWLFRYLRNANVHDTKRIASAIAGVTLNSVEEHLALAEGTGAEKWITPCDYLYLYNSRSDFEADSFGWGLRKEHGVSWVELEGRDRKTYDPCFADDLEFAVRLPNHGRITDPGRYVKDLAAHAEANGAKIIRAEVSEIERDQDGSATGVRIEDNSVDCDAVVLATGAWSGSLTDKIGLKVPLESERGYHIELWEPSIMPKAPVMIASGKFVATPMDGRLRLAGIVELGGLDAPPSRAPYDLLLNKACEAIPGLSWARKTEWMGHRPAPSDSIPVIGEVPHAPGVFTGFGHHHIGLTAGPKTGRLLAQIIAGKQPNLDLSAYSPARFAGRGSKKEN